MISSSPSSLQLQSAPPPPEANLQWMEAAMELAAYSASLGEAPIGAVVIAPEGQLIGRGWNTRQTQNRLTGHAELMALEEACSRLNAWRLPGCQLYVTLEPCIMCAGAIQQARIQSLYFGAFDPKGGAVSSLSKLLDLPGLNHTVLWQGGIEAERCGQLLSQFFRSLRNQKKTFQPK